MCSCLRGVSRWFTPLACGPGSPQSSKSYMDMASKLFTFTFTCSGSCVVPGWHHDVWVPATDVTGDGLTECNCAVHDIYILSINGLNTV